MDKHCGEHRKCNINLFEDNECECVTDEGCPNNGRCRKEPFALNVCEGRRYTDMEKSRASFMSKFLLTVANGLLGIVVWGLGACGFCNKKNIESLLAKNDDELF